MLRRGVRVNRADLNNTIDQPVARLSLIAFVFSSRQTLQFAASKDLRIKASDERVGSERATCVNQSGIGPLESQPMLTNL